MRNNRRQARIMRPYLSTTEFIENTGITRKGLRGYEASGIIEPARVAEGGYYKYWSLEQMELTRLVKAFRQVEMPLPDIAEYANGTDEDMLEAAFEHTIANVRNSRRTLKAITGAIAEISGFSQASVIDGPYIRYIPQRWLALLPRPGAPDAAISQEDFVESYLDLKDIADVVGWARAFGVGAVYTFDSDRVSRFRYVAQGLASPASPSIDDTENLDGGCYRCISPQTTDGSECHSEDCRICSRFGREPTRYELLRWSQAPAPNPATTLMADCPEGREALRLWSKYSKGGQTGVTPSKRIAGVEYDEELVARPLLMPHIARLPLGVTSCTLPAGDYLCMHFETDDFNQQYEQFMKVVGRQPAAPYTGKPSTIVRSVHNGSANLKPNSGEGPFIEKFVNPRSLGDSRRGNCARALRSGAESHVRLLTNVSLPPADGFVVNCTRIPNFGNSRTCYEWQVLVDDPRDVADAQM